MRRIYFWYSFVFKVSHEPELEILNQIPDRAGEIIDVGACDGLSAVSIRFLNQTNPILSFEPNQFHEGRLKWLSRRLAKFSYQMIGIGEEPGEMTLYTPV